MERTGETLIEWRQRMSEIISPYWSGPIMFRKKAGKKELRFQNFCNQMERAHAVVGERTMACAEACLHGIPAYTIDQSITTLLMGGIENLTNIQYPDRKDWWEHICWSQFTVDEFTNGTAPADLVEQYQIYR